MNVVQPKTSQTLHVQWRSGSTETVGRLFASRATRKLSLGIVSAAGYYSGTKLGFALTPVQMPISTLWPPNAIMLAILLLTPFEQWWIPVLAVAPVHLLVQLKTGVPVLTSVGWFVGNIGEALIGAACIRRFVQAEELFDSVRGVVIFLFFGVLVAPLTTSFFDAATVILTGWGYGYWGLWLNRLLSNALAELIFVPVVITFWLHAASWIQKSSLSQYLEACALSLTTVSVSVLVFGLKDASLYRTAAFIYLPVWIFLWAAFRFGLAGLSTSVLAVSLIAIEGALHGKGPFTSASMATNVRSLQVLLGTAATPLILLTSVVVERRKVEVSLHEVAQRLIHAQEQERSRIARELHDDIGQQLVLVQSGLEEIKDRSGTPLKGEITELLEQLDDVSQGARELSHGLHPSHLDHLGLESALQRLCHDIAKKKTIQVSFQAEHLSQALPSSVSLCLYRVSQEALQNVIRHSGASEVALTLSEKQGLIVLRITDNGRGFAVNQRRQMGLGLIGMRERLRAVKGHIHIASHLGEGTVVEATVHLQKTKERN